MKFLTYGLVVITILIVAGFAFLNSQQVDINYLFGAAKMPLVLLLFIALLLGVLISALLMTIKVLKLKHKNRRLEKELQKIPKDSS